MWGQNWGQMIWGKQTTAVVPGLPGAMLPLLAGLLLLVGYWMGRRQRAPRWMALGIGLVVALLPVAIVHATSTFAVPNFFTNGTVADAAQVNANFIGVANEINALRNQTSVITDCDFRPRVSTQPVQCGAGNGGAAYIAGSSDNTLLAAARVPSGATITGADVWVTDTSSSTNLKVCLYSVTDGCCGYDPNAFTCAITNGTPGYVELTLAPTGTEIQGDGVSFELNITSVDSSGSRANWPTDLSLAVRSAYVHYQLP
jgi:hypothetical protein